VNTSGSWKTAVAVRNAFSANTSQQELLLARSAFNRTKRLNDTPNLKIAAVCMLPFCNFLPQPEVRHPSRQSLSDRDNAVALPPVPFPPDIASP